MQIALDAMGGDHAAGPIVAGAVQAVAADPSLHIVLVGDRAQIERCLAKSRIEHGAHGGFPLHPGRDDGRDSRHRPRKKPDNSISRCWQLLAAAQSRGDRQRRQHRRHGRRRPVSAAFLKNVRRPGIAAVMPTLKGPCVLLDVGANVNPKPLHLFQYGVMGSIYAKHILAKAAADHRAHERRLGRAEGPRPGQGDPRPFQGKLLEGSVSSATSKAATSIAESATSSSPTVSSATWCSRSARASPSS